MAVDSAAPALRVGQLWRSRRRGESYRTLKIDGLPVWGDEQYVHVTRNTSRRTQAVSEKTLRRDYELVRDAD